MNVRTVIAVLAAASAFSLASFAAAQDAGPDEVSLKNGGTVRGTVISSEPGTSVKILELGSKEPRVIPWAQVSDVERGKFAPKTTVQPGPAGPGYGAAPPPPTVVAPPPQLGEPGVVRVTIDSPRPVQLVERAGMTVGSVGGYGMVFQHLKPVCTSPCGGILDGRQGQEFLISGDFPSSAPITFAGLRGDVNLSVQPGSFGKRTGGIWLTVLGGTFGILGALALPVSANSDSSGVKAAGIGFLVGGLAMLGGGIALLATSGTKVKLSQPGGAAPQTGRIEPRYWAGEF